MISISGKQWEEKKVSKNLVEKLKQDYKFSEIISKLIISRNFDNDEISSIQVVLEFCLPISASIGLYNLF